MFTIVVVLISLIVGSIGFGVACWSILDTLAQRRNYN
jgi:hypothetical protein